MEKVIIQLKDLKSTGAIQTVYIHSIEIEDGQVVGTVITDKTDEALVIDLDKDAVLIPRVLSFMLGVECDSDTDRFIGGTAIQLAT